MLAEHAAPGQLYCLPILRAPSIDQDVSLSRMWRIHNLTGCLCKMSLCGTAQCHVASSACSSMAALHDSPACGAALRQVVCKLVFHQVFPIIM
jgi:hypothetical protein